MALCFRLPPKCHVTMSSEARRDMRDGALGVRNMQNHMHETDVTNASNLECYNVRDRLTSAIRLGKILLAPNSTQHISTLSSLSSTHV